MGKMFLEELTVTGLARYLRCEVLGEKSEVLFHENVDQYMLRIFLCEIEK